MKYSVVKYKQFDNQRRFGIELEVGSKISKTRIRNAIKAISDRPVLVTRYQPSTENPYWHVKNDATCGDVWTRINSLSLAPCPFGMGVKMLNGIEIASFVGRGTDDLEHIGQVASRLYELGCRVNNNCGLHIHADAADLTKTQVGHILAHWMKVEKCLQWALPLRRRNSKYCKMLGVEKITRMKKAIWKNGSDIYHLCAPTDLGYYENQDRRVNLNLVNYTRACLFENNIRKTLELRWPEGTLSKRDIQCWTRLFLSFIEVCKNRPIPDNFNEPNLNQTLIYLGLGHDGNEFSILSEDMQDTKTWLLERFIEHSEKHEKDAKKIFNLMWSPITKYA
jgi:hypothetical protein